MLKIEQFLVPWQIYLLRGSSISYRHCIEVHPANFTVGGDEGWLLNERDYTTMQPAKLRASFLNAISHCYLEQNHLC